MYFKDCSLFTDLLNFVPYYLPDRVTREGPTEHNAFELL